MNAHDRNFGANDLAKLHYGDGEYAVLRPGRYVVCAVTGQKITRPRTKAAIATVSRIALVARVTSRAMRASARACWPGSRCQRGWGTPSSIG